MKEEIIHLSEHLKGLTDGERTILWQALTIDILGRMLEEDHFISMMLDKERDGLLRARIWQISPRDERDTELMTFGGERVRKT